MCRYMSPLLISGGLKLINTCVQFFPALIVTRILKIVESGKSPFSLFQLPYSSILLILSLFASLCIKSIIENQYFYLVCNAGANIRGVLSAAVYRKALRLSPESRQNTTVCMECPHVFIKKL